MASSSSALGRSRNGCIVCKSRKVKCGEEWDGCSNCQKLGVQCPGYDNQSRNSRSSGVEVLEEVFEAAGVRKRAFGACRQCRKTKHQCTKEKPRCARCIKRRQACSYEPVRDARPSGRTRSPPSTIASQQASPQGADDGEFCWLYSSELPKDEANLNLLAEAYFKTVHPLRVLAFIHRPTFMQSLARHDPTQETSAMIYAMFALVARQLESTVPEKNQSSGDAWARKAQALAFRKISSPSVDILKAFVLLCEYEMRYGQNTTVFMLSSTCFRMAQLLRLENESPEELTSTSASGFVTEAESRRRLMWSCYILDIIVGSGIDNFAMSSRIVPKIQLPCDNRSFTLQIPRKSPRLISEDGQGLVIEEELALEAVFVVVMHLRGRILSSIRIRDFDRPPWSPNSTFLQLEQMLDLLDSRLSTHLRFNDINIYIHKGEAQLAAFYALHVAFHQCYCDLFRILLPGYQFPMRESLISPPPEFLRRYQSECQRHAEAISVMTRRMTAMGGGPFADPLCGICIYESTKIQVIYLTCVATSQLELWDLVSNNIQTNLEALKIIEIRQSKGGLYLRSLCHLLRDFGFSDLARYLNGNQNSSMDALDSGDAVEGDAPALSNLHPLATYQLSWKEMSRSRNPRSQDVSSTSSTGQNHNVVNEQPSFDHNVMESSYAERPNVVTFPAAIKGNPTEAPSFANPQTFTTDQYVQMADGLQNFLTWDPLLFDPNNTSGFTF